MELFPFSCEIIRATAGTAIDEYGDAVSTYGTVQTVCDLQQGGSDEPADAGEASFTTWNLFLPVDAELDTGDAIRVNGNVYQLVGDPWTLDTGSDNVNHVEARVALEGHA